MVDLKDNAKLMIESLPDGKFTFRIRFRGELQPVSVLTDSLEDAEWLGNQQIEHLQRRVNARERIVEFPVYFPSQLF